MMRNFAKFDTKSRVLLWIGCDSGCRPHLWIGLGSADSRLFERM